MKQATIFSIGAAVGGLFMLLLQLAQPAALSLTCEQVEVDGRLRLLCE